MQSGFVNASQLLASFLGSEKEKIGQAIAKNDFSGELKKHLPTKANGAGASAGNAAAAQGKTDAPDAGEKPSSTEPRTLSETKSSLSSSIRNHEGVTGSSAKIKAIRSKAKKEKSLFISNPAVVETVLANLHYPAETRKACRDLMNEQGRISLKDLDSILDTRPESNSEAHAQVPAASARALVGSIVAASDGAKEKQPVPGGGFKPSVEIKTEGFYSRDELRGLLEKILQEAEKETRQAQAESLPSRTGAVETTKTAEGIKAGQAENLVATVLPSFIAGGHRVSSGRIFTGNSGNHKPEAQSAKGKGRDVRENSSRAVSDNSKSDGRQPADKTALAAWDREGIARSVEAEIKGSGNGSSPVSASASSHEHREPAEMPVEGLDLTLKSGNRSKPGPSLEESAPVIATAKTATDSLKTVESRAALGGQDTAMFAKQIEKQAGSRDLAPESAVSQASTPRVHDNGINVPRMDNSARNGFAFNDPHRSAELVRNVREAKAADGPKTGQTEELVATILPSFISADHETGSTAKIFTENPNNPKSEAQKAKRTDAGDNPAEKVSDNSKSDGRQPADKIASDVGGKEGVARRVEAGIKISGNGKPPASASESSLVRQELANLPVDGLDPTMKFASNFGASVKKSASGSGSAKTATDRLKAVESRAALGGQDSTVLAKQLDKQLGSKDSAPENAVLQASASSLHGREINLPLAENSALNSFAFYDPYRAAELAENVREQIGNSLGSQLVLEMEPDGLGKINIKVGAKKDEISVVALTQNEPARQALMSHSVELRQDLRNQGLMLGKFLVDVNHEKSGGRNYPEANKSGGKDRRPSKAARVRNVQTDDVAVHAAKKSNWSQISIFA